LGIPQGATNEVVSYFGGNVSIGTTSPSTTLNVNGTFSVTNTTGTQGLYQDASGNVGIGTTSPTGKLTISQDNSVPSSSGSNIGALDLTHPTSGGISMITFKSTVNWPTDGGYIAYFDDNNNYNYWGDSNENSALVIGVTNDGKASTSDVVALKSPAAVIVDSPNLLVPSGNVGIGTTSPGNKLHVESTRQATVSSANAAARIGGNDVYIFMGSLSASPWSTWIQSLRYSDDAVFPLALNPNGGNVGIGTTSPSYKLHVVGDMFLSGTLYDLAEYISVKDNNFIEPGDVVIIDNSSNILFNNSKSFNNLLGDS
jgi:hypothetical protein